MKYWKLVVLSVMIFFVTSAFSLDDHGKPKIMLKGVSSNTPDKITPVFPPPKDVHLSYPVKRGDFASSFSSPSQKMLIWLLKFDVVEMGGVGDFASIYAINFLKRCGVKEVLCYDWMPAVYYYLDGNNYEFVDWVYETRYLTTLNPEGPFPHTETEDYDFAREYYLDFGNSDVIERRVDFIENALKKYGYSGVFWDWGPGVFIDEPGYSEMKKNFQQRHPEMEYKKAVGLFYAELKKRFDEDDFVIFTNQGYRNAENVLPYVDYDMAESYVTGDFYSGKTLNVRGYGKIKVPETLYFPVSEEGEENFYDTLYHVRYVHELVSTYGGKDFKKFVFMNYAAPEFVYDEKSGEYIPEPPKKAIFLSFATAKLVNETAYLEVPFNNDFNIYNIYFVNLGQALGSDFIVNEEEQYAIRFFENGFVFVYFGNEVQKQIKVSDDFIPKGVYYYDLYNKKWQKASSHSIILNIKTDIDTVSGRTIPAGRVVLYYKSQLACNSM